LIGSVKISIAQNFVGLRGILGVLKHDDFEDVTNFKEEDVWMTIHMYNIPFVNLYKKGYRSLGARSSTQKTSVLPAWRQDLKNSKERGGRRQDKEQIMIKLRSLGYM